MMNKRARHRHAMLLAVAPLLALLLGLATATAEAGPGDRDHWKLDPLSYSIGTFNSFAEIVNIGLKKMALSSALPPDEMDNLEREVQSIIDEWDVEIYREPEFVVTDLFPPSATEGKDVLIIYKGGTLDEYKALKARKAELVAAGQYEGKARRDLAWSMGKLLSYPDAKIRQLLGE